MTPDVTVIVEWDNSALAGSERARQALAGLAREGAASSRRLEIVLCYGEDAAPQLAAAGDGLPAGCRMLHVPGGRYYELKNHGVAGANGALVAFLDSDDRWMAGKLRQQLAFMSANAAVFSFTSFRRISETGDKVGHLIRAPERLDYRALLTNTAIATSSVIIDRAATGSFRMTKTYYDDFVLWLEILKRGHVAHGLDADLLRYRVLGQSVSRNKVNSSRWVWRTYREIEGLDPISAARCFVSYAWHAGLKYRKF